MRRVHVEYYEKNSKNNNKKRALRNWKHDKIKKKKVEILEDIVGKISQKKIEQKDQKKEN